MDHSIENLSESFPAVARIFRVLDLAMVALCFLSAVGELYTHRPVDAVLTEIQGIGWAFSATRPLSLRWPTFVVSSAGVLHSIHSGARVGLWIWSICLCVQLAVVVLLRVFLSPPKAPQ